MTENRMNYVDKLQEILKTLPEEELSAYVNGEKTLAEIMHAMQHDAEDFFASAQAMFDKWKKSYDS